MRETSEVGRSARVSGGGAGKIGRTYRTSALLFCAANFEIWQARYTWVFLQFCVDNYEELKCKRMSTAGGALNLRGMVGFFASTECVTGLDKKDSTFPYYSFPWRVDGDGVVKKNGCSEFTEKVHITRAALRDDNGDNISSISSFIYRWQVISSILYFETSTKLARVSVG